MPHARRIVHSGDALKRKLEVRGALRADRRRRCRAAAWRRPPASALGLGRLSVQSALGEALRAEIDVTSMTPEEAGEPAHARRAARGLPRRRRRLQPGAARHQAQSLQRRADGRQFLRLASDRGVQEPFVDVILEITWATGRLVREYTLLFDPPATAPRRAAGAAPRRRRRRPRRASPRRRRADTARPRAGAARRASAPQRRAARRRRRRAQRRAARAPRRRRRAPAPRPRCRRPARARAASAARRRRVPRPARRLAVARSPAARSAPASRSTRCWWRCSAPTRRPSSATT